MQWQRRGDFVRDFRQITEKYDFDHECKWSRASSKAHLPLYMELLSYFFEHRWLVFHCLVVRKQIVEKTVYHRNDWDLARRKHYTMLLAQKMRRALKRFPNREHEFRVYVDRMPFRYAKANEAMEVISNNILNKEFRHVSPVTSVLTRDSRETPSIQLCDLLLGAVMETWHRRTLNSTKLAIRAEIARHLGWKDLDADRHEVERKFNIWYFHDPTREKRVVTTRTVNLLHPYP